MSGPLLALWLAGCKPPPPGTGDPQPWAPPPVGDLPVQAEPPDPFVLMATGEAITDAAGWEDRRAPEIRLLFAHYVYGYAPPPPAVAARVRDRRDGLEGAAEIVELDVEIGGAGGDSVTMAVIVYLPAARSGPVPVVLGLNKCGNHGLTDDPGVALPVSWPDPACGADSGEAGRGAWAEAWPVRAALARGVAVASVAQGDIDPDDSDPAARAGRVRAVFAPDGEGAEAGGAHAWGTVAAWSWGLSRVIDALAALPELDPDRLMLTGHSRRGKAALWAAALDGRVETVWAHQSGIVGAALDRGSTGETVEAINNFFPHWFAPQFHAFSGDEARLPVDQHLLLGLLAPRAALITDGTEDAWANPPGAEAAAGLARPVYALLGADPERLRWQIRPGDHEVLSDDWTVMLDWWADAAR